MSTAIPRPAHLAAVRALLRQFPVVALLGARQVGKTTLARTIAAAHGGPVTHFDLESAEDRARLADPLVALRPLRGLVIIDEIQHLPELFRTLRVLVDSPPRSRRFLILGSASIALLHQSTETLAGRIAFHELPGLDIEEVGSARLDRLWLRGGFPRAFLARSEAESRRWREEFIRTYLERDIPQLGLRLPSAALRRFWTMIAHYHGQTWNASELGRAFGVSHTTVQRYLDVLSETFMVRQLAPWFENISKRQVRAPRVYVRDTGILHQLLGIPDGRTLTGHPKIGASWEGFAVESVLQRSGARAGEAFFWRTQGGAELDLLLVRGRTRLGFEMKRTSAPSVSPSMRSAISDLRLDRLYVVCATDRPFDLGERIRALPLERLTAEIQPLK
jgi:uncharacterized protein